MLLAACRPPKCHDTMLEFTSASAKRVKHFMVIKVTYSIRVGTRAIGVISVTRKLNAERGTLVGRGKGMHSQAERVRAHKSGTTTGIFLGAFTSDTSALTAPQRNTMSTIALWSTV